MFELLTLYAHTDFMLDEEFNRNGYVVDFATLKDPEYSQDLRDLIQDCLHPTPRHRIRLDILRLSINEYRNRIRDKYEQSDDNEKAKFEYESLLYYVKDEINRMPPGNWQPYDRRKRPEPEKFPDTGRIRYPRFRDGPEKDADDLDNEDYGDAYYGDGDDGDDDEAGAPGGMQQKGMSSKFPKSALTFSPIYHHAFLSLANLVAVTVASRRGGRRRERQSVLKNDLANERADDTSIRPHRRARRIPHPQNVIDNDPANKRIDGSGSRPPRRARRGHRPQLRREDAMIQRPDAGARDGNVGGGGWYVRGWDFRNGRLGDLLEGDMLDDGPDGDGRDGDGTDAGSCNMDLEANDPPSPLPPAPAPALQPPPPAQPPTQTPALQPPPPAPAPPPHLAPPPPPAPPAPQPPLQPPALQPPLQPATRTLRNGKIVKYF